MLNIKLICVGKLKEKFYTDASKEYIKRLGAYCSIEIDEIPEENRSGSRNEADIEAALKKEASAIKNRIPKGAYVISMCIEGKKYDSEGFSRLISELAVSGASRLCFIIGGSDGLHREIKDMSDLRISMSDMTFPHHLARIMLLEQIYRGFKISEGGKYHK